VLGPAAIAVTLTSIEILKKSMNAGARHASTKRADPDQGMPAEGG
jgi:hypothetical protein